MAALNLSLLPVLLQILCFLKPAEPRSLQLKWSKWSQSSTGPVKLDNLFGIHGAVSVMEVANIDREKVLLLCSGDKGKFFTAGINMPKTDGRKISFRITTIGNNFFGTDSEVNHKVKVNAEMYADTMNAFQEVWQPAKEFKLKYDQNENPFYKECKESEKEHEGFQLHIFWFVDGFQKMTAIYKGKHGRAAAAIFWNSDGKIQIEFVEVKNVFEACSRICSLLYLVHKDEKQPIDAKWTRINGEAGEYKDLISEVKKTAIWLSEDVDLSVYATHEISSTLGIIFQIKGFYSRNSFFGVYNITRSNNGKLIYEIRHLGQISTVEESAYLFANFIQRQHGLDTADVLQQNGLAWFHPGGNRFQNEKMNTISEIIETKRKLAKGTIIPKKLNLLPELQNSLHENRTTENFCLIYEDSAHDSEYCYVIIKSPFDANDTEMVVLPTKTYYKTQKEAIDAAANMILNRYRSTLNLEWNSVLPDDDTRFWKSKILVSNFVPPNLSPENLTVIETWSSTSSEIIPDNSTLVIVSYADKNGLSGFFFAALNAAQDITWIGPRVPIKFSSIAVAQRQVKNSAEKYISRIFAFEEKWKYPHYVEASKDLLVSKRGPEIYIVGEKVESPKKPEIHIIAEWDISPAQKILLKKASGFYFEYITILQGKEIVESTCWEQYSANDALEYLSTKIESMLTLPTPQPTEMGTLIRKAKDIMHSKVGGYTSEMILAGLISVHAEKNQSLMILTRDSPGTAYTFVFPVVHDPRCMLLLTPNKFTYSKTFTWEDATHHALLDPLTFTIGAEWKDNGVKEFTEDEQKAIFKAAPWKPGKNGGLVNMNERDVGSICSGGSVHYMCVNWTRNCFFMVWVKDKASYIGGLTSTSSDSKDAYLQYILSPLRFQVAEFRGGIGWLMQDTETVSKIFTGVTTFIKGTNEKLEWKLRDNLSFEGWKFGVIPPPARNQNLKRIDIYCLYGQVVGGYISIVVEAQNVYEIQRYTSVKFGRLQRSAGAVEQDLFDYVALAHELF